MQNKQCVDVTGGWGRRVSAARWARRMAAGACLAPLLWGAMIAPAHAENVTLNLKNADMDAVINMVGGMTGKNFIIDPRVQGKVTVSSARPLDKDEIYQVFLSILDIHGFAAVPNGDVIKIVPNVNAKMTSTTGTGDAHATDQYETRVVQVENVSAMQLVPILRPLLPPEAHMAAHPQSNTLIISDRLGNIERLVNIIGRIDKPSSAEVEIIHLQHASANDVARILATLHLQHQQQKQQDQPVTMMPSLVADERTNSILIGGDLSERLRMRAIVTHLDTPSDTVGDTHVMYLRYAKAKDLVPVLTGVAVQASQEPGKPPTPGKIAFQIQADESTNALVITAAQDVFRSLRSVVQKLDVRRAQVLVEAVIAEVSDDKAAKLGVQWIAFDNRSDGTGPIGAINFPGTGAGLLELGASVAAGVPAIPKIEGMFLGGGRFTSRDDGGGINFAGLISALKGDGATNVLSTPSLVTLDNQSAEITVAQEVPFVTGSFATSAQGGVTSNPFQTIQRKNVGITLKVKPQINEGNSVRLDIEQNVDSVAATAPTGAVDLVTNTRAIKTSVLVDTGRVVVLGGLIRDNLTESTSKVPLLGDIPLLGMLFRHKSTTKTKTNLMVFLKPTIIREDSDTAFVTESKYNSIRNKQLEIREKGVALMSSEQSPLLPLFQDFGQASPPGKPKSDAPGVGIEREEMPVGE